MKIGLIADTHIPGAGPRIPEQVAPALAGVDLILHAGDLHVLSVLDELEAVAPLLAARGNGDIWLPDDPRLQESHLLTIDGLKIGLTHSVEYPEPPWTTLERSLTRDFGVIPDIAVFGDTHVALVETFKGVLLINPGSPTYPNGLKELGTVGILEIDNGRAEARIIQLH